MAAPSEDPPLYCRDAFELFSVAFERLAAELAEQLTEVDFALAGRRVRARILGAELGRMFRNAFELCPGVGEPALEVWLWDESPDTGIDPRVRLECGLDEGAAYVGHRLYRSILASVDVLDRFPHLRSHAQRRDTDSEGKAILMVSELFPHRLVGSCRIEAIVLPRLEAGLPAPRLRRARRAEAVTRMLPN